MALNGGYAGAVCWPAGANQSAILQPFHMVDPEGTEVPAHWGVGLLPSTGAPEGGTQISATVGFLGSHLRGMPNMILRSPQGAWVPQPPFLGPRNGVDDRAVPRPVTGGRGITRLAVIPGIEVADEQGANPRTTNLAVGLSSSDRLYFIDEGDSANPVELGHWQAPGTLLYRIPAVDEVRKWVAMPVQQPEGLVWYVLSLRTPKTPTVIARLKGLGSYGAMSHGVLYTSGNGMLQAVDFGGEQAAAPVAPATQGRDSEERLLGHEGQASRLPSTRDCRYNANKHFRVRILASMVQNGGPEFKATMLQVNRSMPTFVNYKYMSNPDLPLDPTDIVKMNADRPHVVVIGGHGYDGESKGRLPIIENGAVKFDENGNVIYEKTPSYVWGRMTAISGPEKCIKTDEKEFEGTIVKYLHESQNYFRCVENLPDTIVADLVILGVCFSDRIFEQWKPKIIAATPGFSPMVLTVKPGYSNKEMVKGYVWPADVVSALNQVFYNNAYSRMTVRNIVDQFRVEYQNRIRQWGGSPFVVAEVKK